jgi:hypothetical protein
MSKKGKSTKAKGGRTDKQHESFQRYWKGLEVVEATAPLMIVVTKGDVDNAAPGDPEACAASLACKRAYGSTAVVFFHRYAYVDVPAPTKKDPDRRVVHRFALPEETARMIEELDGGGEPPAGGYLLKPPSPSQTLDGMREAQRRRVARARAARMKGEIIEKRTRGRPRRALTIGSPEWVRDGSGLVQMRRSKKPGPGD